MSNIPIEYPIFKELISDGVRFLYKSYDYKAALEEHETKHGKKPNPYFSVNIPEEIKCNHIVWRIGKLRRVHFNPDGKMWKFLIGNKFYKSFFLCDFGVTVKPMIFKSDDIHDLIGRGLAVEETELLK